MRRSAQRTSQERGNARIMSGGSASHGQRNTSGAAGPVDHHLLARR
jgi:hypothetical protein